VHQPEQAENWPRATIHASCSARQRHSATPSTNWRDTDYRVNPAMHKFRDYSGLERPEAPSGTCTRSDCRALLRISCARLQRRGGPARPPWIRSAAAERHNLPGCYFNRRWLKMFGITAVSATRKKKSIPSGQSGTKFKTLPFWRSETIFSKIHSEWMKWTGIQKPRFLALGIDLKNN
jgi:hypothetical protein